MSRPKGLQGGLVVHVRGKRQTYQSGRGGGGNGRLQSSIRSTPSGGGCQTLITKRRGKRLWQRVKQVKIDLIWGRKEIYHRLVGPAHQKNLKKVKKSLTGRRFCRRLVEQTPRCKETRKHFRGGKTLSLTPKKSHAGEGTRQIRRFGEAERPEARKIMGTNSLVERERGRIAFELCQHGFGENIRTRPRAKVNWTKTEEEGRGGETKG